ncbi:hypothetical protein ABK040_003974 [Willaertia magna]
MGGKKKSTNNTNNKASSSSSSSGEKTKSNVKKESKEKKEVTTTIVAKEKTEKKKVDTNKIKKEKSSTSSSRQKKINEKPYKSVLDFIYHSNKLLDKEKEAEAEEASLSSKSFKYVEVEECNMGCNGRANVKLILKSGVNSEFVKVGESITMRIPETTSNSDSSNTKAVRGVISTVTEKFIIATMDEFIDEWYESKLIMNKVFDEVTFKRYEFALKHLEHYEKTPATNIVNLCFKDSTDNDDDDNSGPKMLEDPEVDQLEFFNDNLNDSQKEAIKFALKSKEMALILGPPGTGKTTTIVELIRQAVVLKKLKVLVCAPSNIAVDNIVEKLSDENISSTKKVKLCRIGHPARLMDSVLKHSIDYNISVGEGVKVVNEIRKDINKLSKQILKTRGLERRKLREEMRELERELKVKEKEAIHEVIRWSNVVTCTLTGADDFYLRDKTFDLVIIDEAAQSIEIACWIALLKGKKCVLAGDNFQLPPTVLSPEAQRMGLETTLFERMYYKYKSSISRMLEIQYRMNEEIMQWSSNEFYEGKLLPHDSVKNILLCDIAGVSQDEAEVLTPLLMIDTANLGMDEVQLDSEDSTGSHMGKSKMNNYEVDLVYKYLKHLVNECKVSEYLIGIITPYSAQVQALRTKILDEFPFVEISTVDGFQGREKEVIIISTVRSNNNGDVGFLSEERRMNVAITRAKRHVALIGDSNTLKTDDFLSRMLQYFEDHADIRTADEFQ